MEDQELFYKNGLQFECTRCSACCRFEPGYVFLSQKDLDRLSLHFGISNEEFKKRYCRVVDFGFVKRLSLTEKENYDCIFWDQGCTVYKSRPLQCRAFPFWPQNVLDKESWNETAQGCPGVNRGKVHTQKDIEFWLDQRQNEGLLEK